MRTLLLGAAAAAAIMAPGLASADTSGSVGFVYENSDFDYGEFQAYSLGGTIIHDVHANMTLQADGRTTLQSWDGSTGDSSHGYAAAHLSGDVGGFDIGGFAGIVNYYGDGGVLIGAEARTAFGNFSVDGSIARTDFNDNNFDGTAFRLGGSYFVCPDFAVRVGASTTSIDNGTDYDVTELSLGGAYQFDNDIEIYANYTDTDGDRSVGTDYEGDTLMLGVRLNIGGGTLQDNTNGGAWSSAEHVSNTWMRW